jgi:hypothetical protein
MSTISTSLRVAAAASVLAAATTLVPPTIANATPPAPLLEASLGSSLDTDTIDACDPVDSDCAAVTADLLGAGPIVVPGNLVWLGSPANPDFQPLFGIAFWNPFGFNFEACLLGASVVFSPYTSSGFIGLGVGC